MKSGKLSGKSIASGSLQIKFEEVSSSRTKINIVDGATLRHCVTDFLGGKKCTVFVGIDPGVSPLTLSLILRSRSSRRIASFGIMSAKTDGSWIDQFNRITSIALAVKIILTVVAPINTAINHWLVLEGYSYGSMRGTFMLAELRQGLAGVFMAAGVAKDVVIVPPATWKASVCPGLGKIKGKQPIIDCLIAREPELVQFEKNHNAYDAYALSRLGEMMYDNNGTGKSFSKLRSATYA